MAAAAAATAIAIHHLLRPPSFSYLKPFLHRTLPTFSPLRLLCTPSSSLTHLQIPSPLHSISHIEEEEEEEEEEDDESQQQKKLPQQELEEEEEEAVIVRTEIPIAAASVSSSFPNLPNLSVKEKKDLASYAHSLGKKLKSQQVGKSGITPSVAASFIETLEANELLKLKVHNSCPGELPDVVRQLEEATGSVAVGQIGRAVILYRPSLSKLKAAEKMKQHMQKVRKGFQLKPTEPKGYVARLSNRGRRGSSRFDHAAETKS